MPVYTDADRRDAPRGHMPLPGTDVEIVAYPVNADDLMVLVNKGGRLRLQDDPRSALRTDLNLQKANVYRTDQRIVLGEPPESMREMIRQMLEKK